MKKIILILTVAFFSSFIDINDTIPADLERIALQYDIDLEYFADKYFTTLQKTKLDKCGMVCQQQAIAWRLYPYDNPNYKELNRITKMVFANENYHKLAYSWLKPMIKKSFETMEKAEKAGIYQGLNHMIFYLENYDHEKEKRFLQALASEGKAYRFVFSDYHGYRDLECYVFRRIEARHCTKDQVLYYLKKIKIDLGLS